MDNLLDLLCCAEFGNVHWGRAGGAAAEALNSSGVFNYLPWLGRQ